VNKGANDWQHSFDDFDTFRDLSHLARITVEKIKKFVPDTKIYFFIHNLNFKEYREEDKESAFSITEDNQLITYLAIKNRILNRVNLAEDDFFKDDEINSFLFLEQLEIQAIVPLVYRYKLLGFIGLKFPTDKTQLKKEEKNFLNKLRKELIQNLYAAQLIDQRFSELQTLSIIGSQISSITTLKKLYKNIFSFLAQILYFDRAILWIKNKDENIKIAKSHNIPTKDKKMVLSAGQSISGYTYKSGKPILIKEIAKHSFFANRNEEKWFTNSLLSFPLKANSKLLGVLTIHSDKPEREFTGEHLHLVSIFSGFIGAAISSISSYDKLEKGYIDTITALVATLDAKDPYTAGHSERVMEYSVGIAKIMKLPKKKIRLIRFASILHDIGKIGINGQIIRKTERLTDNEYKIIQKHPEIGDQIISAIDFLQEVRPLIKYHHERVDGKGYYNISKKELPQEALILSIADAFDAMTTDRSYRKGYPYEVALDMIKKDICTQFSSESFDALILYLKKHHLIKQDYS